MNDAIGSSCPEWCTDHTHVELELGAGDYHHGAVAQIFRPVPQTPRLHLAGAQLAVPEPVPMLTVTVTRRDGDDGREPFEQVGLSGPFFAIPMGISPADAEKLAAALTEAVRTLRA